jgi:hypothetical protein
MMPITRGLFAPLLLFSADKVCVFKQIRHISEEQRIVPDVLVI